MKKITNIVLVGGTHGNELAGIYLLKKWQATHHYYHWDSLNITPVIANPRACAHSVRYMETDLNREFDIDTLNNTEQVGYEQLLAKKLNQQFGPKDHSPTELMIDLHNTTSNMGACLMLIRKDTFNIWLGAYVKHHMPDAVIFFQDEIPQDQRRFLITLAQQGVTVEVGPQPNGVLQQETLELMEQMTQHILDFVVLYNRHQLPPLPTEYEAFQYTETLRFPTDAQGQRLAIIAKSMEQQDFQPLLPGTIIMETLTGQPLIWEGSYTAYPLFINEAAYQKNHDAMSLSKQVTICCSETDLSVSS